MFISELGEVKKSPRKLQGKKATINFQEGNSNIPPINFQITKNEFGGKVNGSCV